MKKHIKIALLNASLIVPILILGLHIMEATDKYDSLNAYGYSRLSWLMVSVVIFIVIIVWINKWAAKKNKTGSKNIKA